jgi:hypothetical protein
VQTADRSYGPIHPEGSRERFDLRSSAFICVHLRYNFLLTTGSASLSGVPRRPSPRLAASAKVTAEQRDWVYPFPTDFSIVPGTLAARLFCAFASSAFLALLPTLEPSQ